MQPNRTTLHLPTKEISPLAGKALQLLSQARCEDNPEARLFLQGLARTYIQRSRRKEHERKERQVALAWAESIQRELNGEQRVHYIDVIKGLPRQEMAEVRRASPRINMWA